MTTNTISTHIAAIQQLAAELTEAQHDHQQLQAVTDKIQSISWKLYLEVEDAESRLATHYFKKLGKEAVTIKEFADMWWNGDPDAISYYSHKLRYYLQAGMISGIHKKNRQWLCTKETMAEYLRVSAKQDEKRRQMIAERKAAESLKLAA